MMKHITVAAAVVTLLAATVASAQTVVSPQAPAGQPGQNLGQRVRDGIKSGQLTRTEVQAIRGRLTALRAHARELRGSGTLSPAERRELRGQWRRLNRMVFGLKHNGIKRGGRT